MMLQTKTQGRFCRVALAASLVLAAAGLGGCSYFSKDEDPLAFQEEPADKLFGEAQTLLNNREWSEAAKKFEEVDRQHPYSPLARRSIVLSAYCYYQRREYDEAIAAGKRYITLHPTGEEADYAQYLVAISYYDQIPDVLRDQTKTQAALDALNEVVRRYPESQYARAASNKVEEARAQLAGKEMEVGRYYLKRQNYIAALNRFKTVVEQHQTTAHVEEALARLTETYLAMGIASEAQTAAAILGHNYPSSQWYKDSYALLQSNGLEPREDKGSWLSRVWKSTVGL